jgi:hypothetical protein
MLPSILSLALAAGSLSDRQGGGLCWDGKKIAATRFAEKVALTERSRDHGFVQVQSSIDVGWIDELMNTSIHGQRRGPESRAN